MFSTHKSRHQRVGIILCSLDGLILRLNDRDVVKSGDVDPSTTDNPLTANASIVRQRISVTMAIDSGQRDCHLREQCLT